LTGYEHCWPDESKKVCPPKFVIMCRGWFKTFVVCRRAVGYGSSAAVQNGCVEGRARVMNDLQHQYGDPGEL
jgi:hypothetical protein